MDLEHLFLTVSNLEHLFLTVSDLENTGNLDVHVHMTYILHRFPVTWHNTSTHTHAHQVKQYVKSLSLSHNLYSRNFYIPLYCLQIRNIRIISKSHNSRTRYMFIWHSFLLLPAESPPQKVCPFFLDNLLIFQIHNEVVWYAH